jgi:hypothetical protein
MFTPVDISQCGSESFGPLGRSRISLADHPDKLVGEHHEATLGRVHEPSAAVR